MSPLAWAEHPWFTEPLLPEAEGQELAAEAPIAGSTRGPRA